MAVSQVCVRSWVLLSLSLPSFIGKRKGANSFSFLPSFLVFISLVIWDALKAAVDVDRDSAKLILEAADVIIEKQDLSVCYDQKGRKYELPVYILSEPVNILEDED